MAVQKFRTLEEARRALWLPTGDPAILVRMKRMAELRSESARREPSGVHRFRTIEEAKGARGRPSFGSAR